LKRRLDEGRAQLRRRLERRGLTLSAALLTAGVSGAAVSSSLAATIVTAGLAVASGGRPAVSAGVASLLRAVTARPRLALAAVLGARALSPPGPWPPGWPPPARGGGRPAAGRQGTDRGPAGPPRRQAGPDHQGDRRRCRRQAGRRRQGGRHRPGRAAPPG